MTDSHKCRNCGTPYHVTLDEDYTGAYLCYDCWMEYHMAYKKGLDTATERIFKATESTQEATQ